MTNQEQGAPSWDEIMEPKKETTHVTPQGRTVVAETGEVVSEPKQHAIVVQESKGDIQTQDLDMKVMNPKQLEAAFTLYRQSQAVIDKMMPDAIMTIGYGDNAKQFRKKSYWRAIGIAFSLRVECTREEFIEMKNGDWGYSVTYRATRPNGSFAEGDGTCMASDKNAYKWKVNPQTHKREKTDEVDVEKTKINATPHNVRAHAHTRAFNRAVSNCVGFGEVSAEELP